MSSPLAKYIGRSPRYILQPSDNTLIRLAGPQQTPWEEGTEILNVSQTGIAFTAPADLSPIVGETIRIQFDVPGTTSMACLALVTRVESKTVDVVLVAAQYVELENSQRIFLSQGISKKIDPKKADPNEFHFGTKRRKEIFLLYFAIGIFLLIGWCGLFFIWYPVK